MGSKHLDVTNQESVVLGTWVTHLQNIRNRAISIIGYFSFVQAEKLENIECNIASLLFIYYIKNLYNML